MSDGRLHARNLFAQFILMLNSLREQAARSREKLKKRAFLFHFLLLVLLHFVQSVCAFCAHFSARLLMINRAGRLFARAADTHLCCFEMRLPALLLLLLWRGRGRDDVRRARRRNGHLHRVHCAYLLALYGERVRDEPRARLRGLVRLHARLWRARVGGRRVLRAAAAAAAGRWLRRVAVHSDTCRFDCARRRRCCR